MRDLFGDGRVVPGGHVLVPAALVRAGPDPPPGTGAPWTTGRGEPRWPPISCGPPPLPRTTSSTPLRGSVRPRTARRRSSPTSGRSRRTELPRAIELSFLLTARRCCWTTSTPTVRSLWTTRTRTSTRTGGSSRSSACGGAWAAVKAAGALIDLRRAPTKSAAHRGDARPDQRPDRPSHRRLRGPGPAPRVPVRCGWGRLSGAVSPGGSVSSSSPGHGAVLVSRGRD
jgi:hypothetical protein